MPQNPAYQITPAATAMTAAVTDTIVVDPDPIPVPAHVVAAVEKNGPEAYRPQPTNQL